MPDWMSECGTVRLWRGDCHEVMPRHWRPGAIAAIVTDPPYGVGGYVATPSKWRRARGVKGEAWDNAPGEVAGLSVYGCPVCVWGGNYFNLPPSRGWIVWHKPDAPPSMAAVELAWTNRDANGIHVVYSIGATNRERVGHPTQKPVEVMRRSIEYVLGGECGPRVIADPYMGSGTTAIAAIRLGMQFWGVEVSEEYFRVSVKRIRAELERFPLLDSVRKDKPRQRPLEWS